MSDLEQDETKPPRYVGTIGHVSSRKSLMTAAIMKMLAEAGTKQEVQAMAEDQTKPTAWKSMESAPRDGREILVRRFNFGRVEHSVAEAVPGAWLCERRLRSSSEFHSWTDIPS